MDNVVPHRQLFNVVAHYFDNFDFVHTTVSWFK